MEALMPYAPFLVGAAYLLIYRLAFRAHTKETD
jgi:hypothetical protein